MKNEHSLAEQKKRKVFFFSEKFSVLGQNQSVVFDCRWLDGFICMYMFLFVWVFCAYLLVGL